MSEVAAVEGKKDLLSSLTPELRAKFDQEKLVIQERVKKFSSPLAGLVLAKTAIDFLGYLNEGFVKENEIEEFFTLAKENVLKALEYERAVKEFAQAQELTATGATSQA